MDRKKVCKELIDLELTQKEFANQIGATYIHVNQLLNGNRQASIKLAEKIAHVLGGELEDYFTLYVGDRQVAFV